MKETRRQRRQRIRDAYRDACQEPSEARLPKRARKLLNKVRRARNAMTDPGGHYIPTQDRGSLSPDFYRQFGGTRYKEPQRSDPDEQPQRNPTATDPTGPDPEST